MNITTKFNIGDTVFRLYENKVQKVEVAFIQINAKPAVMGSTDICYTLTNPDGETGYSATHEYEWMLFATKAELLASL